MQSMVRGTKGAEENSRVSTYCPKSRECFLEETIFQIGGGAEYRAYEQLFCVLDLLVFDIADGGLT